MAIVTGGRLADLFGRRRAFFLGSALFAGFSLLGGAAQTAPWLIATRVGMGIGGALMWPAILGMTYAALPDSKAGLAGGLILGAAGIGNAMGPLLGGVLTDELSWRWIFFLNVPIAAFAVLVTWLKVHQPRPEVEDQRIDYPGIATLSTGLLLILLAFDQAADWGFGDPRVIAMLVVAAGLIVVLRLHRAADEEERADPERGDPQRRVPLSVPHRAPHVGRVLLRQCCTRRSSWRRSSATRRSRRGWAWSPMLGTFAIVSFFAGPAYQRLGAKPHDHGRAPWA